MSTEIDRARDSAYTAVALVTTGLHDYSPSAIREAIPLDIDFVRVIQFLTAIAAQGWKALCEEIDQDPHELWQTWATSFVALVDARPS